MILKFDSIGYLEDAQERVYLEDVRFAAGPEFSVVDIVFRDGELVDKTLTLPGVFMYSEGTPAMLVEAE